jgi:hypothetical protein
LLRTFRTNNIDDDGGGLPMLVNRLGSADGLIEQQNKALILLGREKRGAPSGAANGGVNFYRAPSLTCQEI